MRFWGKILGREGDYYIAEALAEEPTEEIDINLQEGIDGGNKFRYWALPSAALIENGILNIGY